MEGGSEAMEGERGRGVWRSAGLGVISECVEKLCALQHVL